MNNKCSQTQYQNVAQLLKLLQKLFEFEFLTLPVTGNLVLCSAFSNEGFSTFKNIVTPDIRI